MYIQVKSRGPTPKKVNFISKERRHSKDVRAINKKIKNLRKETKDIIINQLRDDFAVSTTHGIPYIVNRDLHWFERLFWVFLFTGNLIFAVYLLAKQFERFIVTPTVMSVEMDYFNWNVSYPSITICPMIKADSSKFIDLVNEMKEKTGKNTEQYLWAIVSSTLEYMDAVDINVPPDILELINPRDYAAIAASVFKAFDASSMTTNTNWPISVEAVMTEQGMCHTVNSNIAPFDDPLQWNNTTLASYSKKNIELSVHDRDFFTQIMGYADTYTVFLHNPDETILTTSPSYVHMLKGFMSFGVQMWVTKTTDEVKEAEIRLRKCRYELLDEPTSERYPVYSYNRCMLDCRIQMILKVCGCVPHFYKPLPNERVCRIDELKCIVKYKVELRSIASTEDMRKKYGELPRSSHECGCFSLCDNVVYLKDDETFIAQPDFNRLRIGVTSYPKSRVVREFIFSFNDIVLKIGGVINLCIGSSIISMIEMLVTLIKIPLYILMHKIKHSMQVREVFS
ncbi:amiloride-sensitive sodium channel domain-containing protein [Phthorimaea operculella]|nr:amiloride-sensitive sodium channel domain-containing protein [Phthorimaea operculella]